MPITVIGPIKQSATGVHSLMALQGSGALPGSTGLYMLSSTPVEGSYNSFRFAAVANVNRAMVENQKSGGSTVVDLMTSGGNSMLRYFDAAFGTGYMAGFHASTSDWVLQQASASFGSGRFLARYVRARDVFQMGSLLQLRSYLEASLPTAAVAGAGSLAWAHSADGTGNLVVSDGSGWRTVQTSPPSGATSAGPSRPLLSFSGWTGALKVPDSNTLFSVVHGHGGALFRWYGLGSFPIPQVRTVSGG